MVTDLLDAELQVLDALIDAPTAWQTPDELAQGLDWSLDDTLDAVANLDAAGWLDAWELADGPAVTLSVAATHRLGVRLVEVGVDETPRWARPGALDPVARRAVGVFRSERMAQLDLVADRRVGVEQALIRVEEAEQAALAPPGLGREAQREAAVFRPILLVGVGLTPWPGPLGVTGSSCPACGTAPLPSHAYCIRCDRSGRDQPALGVSGSRAEGPPVATTPRLPTAATLARRRERERQRRQAKRRRRRVVQAQAQRAWAAPRMTVPLWMAPVAG